MQAIAPLANRQLGRTHLAGIGYLQITLPTTISRSGIWAAFIAAPASLLPFPSRFRALSIARHRYLGQGPLTVMSDFRKQTLSLFCVSGMPALSCYAPYVRCVLYAPIAGYMRYAPYVPYAGFVLLYSVCLICFICTNYSIYLNCTICPRCPMRPICPICPPRGVCPLCPIWALPRGSLVRLSNDGLKIPKLSKLKNLK